MFNYPPRRKNPPIRRDATMGFKEMNTLAHPAMLKNEEASEILNAIYSQYGTTSRRAGSIQLGTNRGGAAVTKLFPAYGIRPTGSTGSGTDYLVQISTNGVPQYFNFTTNAWVNLSGTAPVGYVGTNPAFSAGTPTFNMTTPVQIVQAYNMLWFSNAVNDMVWFDGTAWFIRTALADPTTKATVAKTGSGTGTRTYYYRYVNYNASGGTLASPVFASGDASGTGYIGSMPAVLDGDTYLTVTIPAAPAGTTKRGIFRGNTAGNEFYLAELAAGETTYVDKGQTDITITSGIPTSNTTKGYHYHLMKIFERRMVGVTKEMGNSVITWSDPYPVRGDFLHSPGLSGFDDYYDGDGENINAIETYSANNQSGFYVFKDSRIGALTDDGDGGYRMIDVTSFVGAVSASSPHVAGNNLRFWSPEGPATLGNEKNYGSVLRYSVLGLKVENITQRITAGADRNVASIFEQHRSYFAFSTRADGANNQVLVYDERYDAWSLWTGLFPRCFAMFRDRGNRRLFYGSSIDPKVIEMNVGKTDYGTTGLNGTKVVYSLSTGQYTLGAPDRFKKGSRIVFMFGDLYGTNTKISLTYSNENGVFREDPITVTQAMQKIGFGTQLWGTSLVGSVDIIAAGDSITTKYIDLAQQDIFWVQATITNDGIDDAMSLLGVVIYYSDSDRMLPFESLLVRQ